MIHRLLFKTGNPIVEIETSKDDLHAVINVIGYSELLLSLSEKRQNECAVDFHLVSELRGVYHEQVPKGAKSPQLIAVDAITFLRAKYDLEYGSD